MAAVRSLLAQWRLEQYADKFDEEGYDDIDFLKSLKRDDKAALETVLREGIGMKAGHVAKFVQWLE